MRRLYIFIILVVGFMACKKDTDLLENEEAKSLLDSQKPLPSCVISDVPYGKDSLQKMDIYLPEGRDMNTKVIFFLHGGAWVWGDKSSDGLEYLRPTLLSEGYAIASINYRKACGDITKQMQDIGLATNTVSAQADNWICNPNKFGLLGRSSGAHLALLYAHTYDQENTVKSVISIVAPTDISDTIFHQYARNADFYWAVDQLVGARFSENPQAYMNASPLHNTSNKPTFFIWGTQDTIVPYHQGIKMFTKLKNEGVITDKFVFTNTGHNIQGPLNVNVAKIRKEILQWLNHTLD